MEPTVLNPDPAADPVNSVPAVYRLLVPVNAGVSAARHLAWYIRYHAASQQRPARQLGNPRLDPAGPARGHDRSGDHPGRTEPGGCIGTTAVGILGALIGGFIATALDIGEIDEFFDLGTWLIARSAARPAVAADPRVLALGPPVTVCSAHGGDGP